MTARGRVQAVLGPTNTGKTHYAIERMLSHRTGVIGLPLRLLAREVYDRIVAKRGPSVVALVTGEERIVPERTQYWVCTVEAMPEGLGADFVAIDEIQLCADPERGHVFTDRLLRARGFKETLFLGASTMRGAIAAQVPEATFQSRERFSELSYTGMKKISRMPARSAIVGFSVDSVYSIAEVIRRLKGGAAVVMGALSPRTRNAQVEMYQNGDVDYLVATDAIGMGLNLDIRHVAFSSTHKFDGRRMRPLQPNELAQIAGRAGRHTEDGTFGVTGEARPLHEELAQAIVDNRFAPVTKLQWRNSRLNFANLGGLIASLEEHTSDEWLTRARDADDILALKSLAASVEVRNRANNAKSIRLLWDVCRIPDFRGISETEHAALLERLYEFLHDRGRISDDWMAAQVRRIDRTEGDIDALSKRLAYIRTWTYVAQRQGWLDDESHWREVTRSVEDRLSDALHARLTQRFVDRRTSVLLRRLKEKESLVAEVNDKGEVTVEGQFVGRLEGFRFSQDKAATADEAKTLRQAAVAALAPEFHLRADRFYNAPDTELDFTDQGGLMWGEHAVGKLAVGAETLKPQVKAFVDEEAGAEVAQKVQRRLQHFIDRKINAAFEPLLAMSRDEALSPAARGFAFRLTEGQGIIPRDQIAQEVKALDQETRGQLRKHGVRFGQFTIFLPLLLKPAPTRLRLVLWALDSNLDDFPSAPPPGLVTVPTDEHVPEGYHPMAGYRPAGVRSIRIDMLERLADLLRAQDTRGGFEATPDMLSITGMTLEQFADLMQGLGYKAERGERQKAKPAPAAAETPAAEAAAEVGAEEAPAEAADAAEAEAEAPAVEVQAAEAPAEEAPAEEASAPEAETVAEAAPAEADAEAAADAEAPAEADAEAEAEAEAPVEAAAEADAEAAAPAEEDAEVVTEVFYTFAWAPRRRGGERNGGRKNFRGQSQGGEGGGKRDGKPRSEGGGKPRGKGKPGGGKRDWNKDGPRKEQGAKVYSSKPQRKEKAIDPDNPFAAALMGLKDKR
ncbi:helicase-related protein [Poseidonocella sp. HB161398]|uniref:helicase-related protein n=1 Tax=Poseidonocella sp. HB161398 TaxID=2320855 RepID=UPI0011097F71|nr:helicase-related protein [Poseidonocella sp. HB161398]